MKTAQDYRLQDEQLEVMLKHYRSRGYSDGELDHIQAGWDYAMDHDGRVESPYSIATDMAECAYDEDNDDSRDSVAGLISEGLRAGVKFFGTGKWDGR